MTTKEFVIKLKQYFNETNEERIIQVGIWLNEHHLSESQLDKLFINVIESEQFFPMIAVLKKYIQGNNASKAYEAYGIALKALSNRTANEVAKKYPSIHQTIIQSWGGWSEFGNDSQASYIRQKQFMDCYLSINDLNTKKIGDS